MKKLSVLTLPVLVFACLAAPATFARDDIAEYSIEEAMGLEQSRMALGDQVKFFFGNASPGNVVQNFGEFRTNKKTNGVGKSDKQACQWVFLSAMLSLRDRALAEGGNAVMNIKSNYKNNLTVSDTTFRCGSGALMSGVALVGTVVTVE